MGKQNLPKLRWIKTPNADCLSEWFRCREISLRLCVEEGVKPTKNSALTQNREIASYVAPFDKDVKIGDIRLLPACLTPMTARPVYISAFKQWEEDTVLVAPFSPYHLPATTTELMFQNRRPALRVACLWNGRTVSQEFLAQSWFVDTHSAEEMTDIWHIFRHAATGRVVPENLVSRVGAPIRSLTDPRITYQDEETLVMDTLSETQYDNA